MINHDIVLVKLIAVIWGVVTSKTMLKGARNTSRHVLNNKYQQYQDQNDYSNCLLLTPITVYRDTHHFNSEPLNCLLVVCTLSFPVLLGIIADNTGVLIFSYEFYLQSC